MSYPYLYRNWDASDWARWTWLRASAVRPVMTHPIEGVIWKMCVTELGSRSLSFYFVSFAGGKKNETQSSV